MFDPMDTPDAIDIDGSGHALRLDPIRPSTSSGPMMNTFGGGLPRPPRRTSQDEIRALLQRTDQALEKIVRIRESMEPFVDFSQFDKKPRGGVGGPGDSGSGSRGSHRRLSRGSSVLEDMPVADSSLLPHSNRSLALESEGSEDPLGDRSTGSTESTSSIEDGRETNRTTGVSTASDDDKSHHTRHDDEDKDDLSDLDSSDDEDDEDDDDDSAFEVSAFKEARLDRLRNLPVDFHEGLPTEFFMALARFLNGTVELKTRHSRFNFYKDTFVGSDAVREMILSGFAEDQPMALRYGNVLVKLGYIEHVSRTDDQLHNNKDNFYRFTRALDYDDGDFVTDPGARMSITANNYRESVLARDSAANVEYDFSEASDEVHALVTEEALAIIARVLHKVFERKNKLLYYKGFVGCFLGAEAVNVIRELRVASSLIDAVLIGQALLDEKVIEPIATTITTFQDKYVFYRLTQIRQ